MGMDDWIPSETKAIYLIQTEKWYIRIFKPTNLKKERIS